MERRHAPAVFFAAGILVGSVCAQTGSFVVPSKALLREPGTVWGDLALQDHLIPWSFATARTQYLYDVSDIPVAAAMLRSIAFRGVAGPYGSIPSSSDAVIRVSTSPHDSSNSSLVFAQNEGPDVAIVYSGTINGGLVSRVPWPAPWESAIPFSQPFLWSAPTQGSLAVDFDVYQSYSWGPPWFAEGLRAEFGNAWTENARMDCLNSGGWASVNYRTDATSLLPGGTFNLWLDNYPSNPSLAANMLLFGLRGVGAPFGAFTTPFPMRQAGMLAPMNCEWAISSLIGAGVPMTYHDFGPGAVMELLDLPIPNDPHLVGVDFFTQDLALDVVNTNPWLFPSVALRWKIGSGATIPCCTILRDGRPGLYGARYRSEALTLRVDY